MKIKAVKNLTDNNYQIALTVIDLKEGDYLNAIHDFGENPINIGGDILDSNKSKLTTLIPYNIKITDISENPVIQNFYVSQYDNEVNTIKIADMWLEQTIDKIKTYVIDITTKIDSFSTIIDYDM